MSILSIHFDESGNLNLSNRQKPEYRITLVFHNQTEDISSAISILDDKLSRIDLEVPPIHAIPLIRQDKNILRMKRFYETYKDNEKLSPLVAEIPWTNNLLLMTACKTDEAKEFYLKACIENYYSKRELERQDGSSQQFFCFVISSIFLRSVSSSFCSSSAVGSSSLYFEAKICLPSLRTEYLTMASFF